MLLIKRTARAVIMLATLEKRVLDSLDLGDLEARQMIALANSVRMNLSVLGIKRPKQQTPHLANYLSTYSKASPRRPHLTTVA